MILPVRAQLWISLAHFRLGGEGHCFAWHVRVSLVFYFILFILFYFQILNRRTHCGWCVI